MIWSASANSVKSGLLFHDIFFSKCRRIFQHEALGHMILWELWQVRPWISHLRL